MNILIVAATQFEIMPLLDHLQQHGQQKEGGSSYQLLHNHIHLLITGVGLVHTAFALGNYLTKHKIDIAINVGIAGSFRREWTLGTVVQVINERFADIGVEEADGQFRDIFELNLIKPNQSPYINSKLYNPTADTYSFLPKAVGVSVNRVTGTEASIQQLVAKYNPDVETMEGAAFFYACLSAMVPNFIAIRGISNYVEPRNKENWNIGLAIENSNQTLLEMLEVLGEN